MKKLFLIIIAAIMVLSLGACTQRDNKKEELKPGQNQGQSQGDNQPVATTYKDGTYTAEGDPWQYGKEDATVVVNDGKMSQINLRRLDTSGKEVNYEQWTGKEVNGTKYPNLKQFRVDMANRMITSQSPEVETISGATVSCANWKLAVRRALEKATK